MTTMAYITLWFGFLVIGCVVFLLGIDRLCKSVDKLRDTIFTIYWERTTTSKDR